MTRGKENSECISGPRAMDDMFMSVVPYIIKLVKQVFSMASRCVPEEGEEHQECEIVTWRSR